MRARAQDRQWSLSREDFSLGSAQILTGMCTSQLGHDGASPESCWLVEELCLAVPTQGTKYTLRCNCWLAKDRGDGVTSRVFDLLDAMVVNIGVKVCVSPASGGRKKGESEGYRRVVTGILAEAIAWEDSWTHLKPGDRSLLVCCCVTSGNSPGCLWALVFSYATCK